MINKLFGNLTFLFRILWAVTAGPGVLIFQLSERKRKKSAEYPVGSPLKIVVFSGLIFLYYLILFLIPVYWAVVLGIHIGCSLIIILRNPGITLFPADPDFTTASGLQHVSFSNTFWASVICFIPLFFAGGMIESIYSTTLFSVQNPSGIFLSGFKWVLFALPGCIISALLFYRMRIHFDAGHISRFFFTFILLAGGLVFLEVFHNYLTEISGAVKDDPILFSFPAETAFRDWVQNIFILIAAVNLFPFLVFSNGAGVLFRRALLSLVILFMVFLNLLMATGEWNYYLGALQNRFLNSCQYEGAKWAYIIQLQRTPDIINAPDILMRLAELEYQRGHEEKARRLYIKLSGTYGHIPYYQEYVKSARDILDSWERYISGGDKNGDSGSSIISLDVPVIKKADYLTLNWYGVLSGIAYRYIELDDLGLKEKLLKLFSLDDHQLPLVENIPGLVPALNRMDVPHCTAFFTNQKIIRALKAGLVPLVYYNYSWTPIVAYDKRRCGFLYYDYSVHYNQATGINEDDGAVIFSREKQSGGEKTEIKYAYQRFISSSELKQHIINIGGVGIFIGDSNFVSSAERRAAFLVELGDIYYQSQNNFNLAAASYAKALKLDSNIIIEERMAFLKRYYGQIRSGVKNASRLYNLDKIDPDWGAEYAFSGERWDFLVSRVLSGKAGWIIMEQWPARSMYQDSATLDTLIVIYDFLHERQPFSPRYLDTLARLEYERRNYIRSEKLYERLISLRPKENKGMYFRLAWIKLLCDKPDEISRLLELTDPSENPPRYLTMEAAALLERGKIRKALKKLQKSVKEDKTIGQTHKLMARCYGILGNNIKQELHIKWYERCENML